MQDFGYGVVFLEVISWEIKDIKAISWLLQRLAMEIAKINE